MNKLTKILTSIGPTSEDKIKELVDAGTNVCRLNFSHDSLEVQGRKIDKIREVQSEIAKPIAVLVDLQGPKHRIGDFKDGQLSGVNKRYNLTVGQKFILDSDPTPGDETRVCLPDHDVMASLEQGTVVLLNDGKMELVVTKRISPDSVETTVVRGSEIWDRRAFNIPNAEIATSVLQPKDRTDLDFALTKNPDFVAISFVQKAEDVIEAREYIKARTDRKIKIVSKLERPMAVGDRLESIIEVSDAIMIARGDLAVEIPFEQVPSVQRKIIRMCRAMNKPVIVATQMLGSMDKSLFPTRAEVSDVATAGYLFTDATMTSEETSLGIYPVETTSTMAKILKASEDDILVNELDESDGDVMEGENDKFDKIAAFAESEDAAAIISFDNDWEQTVKLSCRRSYLPIIAIAGQSIVANQMCMLRGVSPVYDEAAFDKKDINAALRTNLVQKGDTVVVVSNGGDTVEIKTM